MPSPMMLEYILLSVAAVPTLTACSNCGAMHIYHTVCGECGYYRGKLAVEKMAAV